MFEPVPREYSKRQIKEAGKVLSVPVLRTPETIEAFRVAHNWRMAHAYPMIREKTKLTAKAKPLEGITAGRIKRMSSIRKKLFRAHTDLSDMQDLVGCRAILPGMPEVNELVSQYRFISDGGSVYRINNYIENPKSGGYRCIHLIIKFNESGKGLEAKGRKVELQIRTNLQHVWATTVEAVGAMRNEDLKAGEGDKRWLRFLELMAAHMADLEGTDIGPYVPSNVTERLRETRQLAFDLKAHANLSTYRSFMKEAEDTSHGHGFNGSNYVLKMNAQTGTLEIESRWKHLFDVDSVFNDDYDEAHQTLSVNVENMHTLRAAYPNYFLDVRSFLDILDDLQIKAYPFGSGGVGPNSLDLSFLRNYRKPK